MEVIKSQDALNELVSNQMTRDFLELVWGKNKMR